MQLDTTIIDRRSSKGEMTSEMNGPPRTFVVKSISQIFRCECRTSTCSDLPTHGGGTPDRALLYSLVLTLCSRRLGWLELFVMALGDVDLAEGLGLRVRSRC